MPCMKTRRCYRCKKEKALDHFYRSSRDGYVGECKECRKKTAHQRYLENKEHILAVNSRWHKANLDHHNALNREWDKRNPDKRREITRRHYYKYHTREIARVIDWRKRNPDKFAIYCKNNRAMRRGAEGRHTLREWQELCERYDNKCAACGKPAKLTVDHIVPLTKGGTNYIENIQPLCQSCNSSKNSKTIDYRGGASRAR
jgi:5-methylcytosine-specific restriction endonuclease McrA